MISKQLQPKSIYSVLLAATVAVTLIVTFLLIPVEWRGDKFFLSMIAILIAEVITFLYPMILSSPDHREQSVAFPFLLGFGIVILIYDALIIGLVLAASFISFKILLALHLIVLLCLFIVSGIWKIALQKADA